jgi:hypothetical protein
MALTSNAGRWETYSKASSNAARAIPNEIPAASVRLFDSVTMAWRSPLPSTPIKASPGSYSASPSARKAYLSEVTSMPPLNAGGRVLAQLGSSGSRNWSCQRLRT